MGRCVGCFPARPRLPPQEPPPVHPPRGRHLSHQHSPPWRRLLVEAVGDVSLRRFHVSRFSFAVARSWTSRCQKDPFIFPPYHKAAREPFDYYMFGQNYIHPLVDFRNSYVGNIPVFHEIREKLQEGHNIVLISNHQTEADPAVIALLLEGTHSHIAENVTYVAGDRVVTDPLCKPFSMGRNLVCVYSKKHMFDVPELVEMKRRSNTRSLKEMALLLRGGSQLLWIAPSGGRDRPDPLTGEWYPAPFDFAVVDNTRRLVEHSAVPGHLYPLALLC
ncbi:glycerol-3-phosphate acyltransferase ATS12, chloroplastic-like [Eucalyptus grandis]|uniref:glycerol-3-phosphate acyltransferase ATS12, chloroplastic-like n=1 Tax=Eucalyptus grandis TaxID=71139 RepID=UPI00192EF710|nr:glycerol-3-phosphate acyltransferase ATS12, chloroplastic-like [Eucalyptus grandis]